jgi:hypothetical protein
MTQDKKDIPINGDAVSCFLRFFHQLGSRLLHLKNPLPDIDS